MLFMRSTGFIQSNLVHKYQQATCTLMDVRDVAALLRVSKSMVYKLAEQGALHAVRTAGSSASRGATSTRSSARASRSLPGLPGGRSRGVPSARRRS